VKSFCGNVHSTERGDGRGILGRKVVRMSLLYNGYRVFPGIEAAGAWG
jgi:hypothetical protein